MLRYILLLGSLLAILPHSERPRDPSGSPLAGFDWMAGCWQARSGTHILDEQWMAPRGRLMIGMSRTFDGAEVRAYEHMTIRADSAGVVFRAEPSGQEPGEFLMISRSDTSVTFENAAHDFPRRIIYRSAAGGDSLLARIEGAIDGEDQAVDFPFGRVACTGE
jgi:hypothetical protein